MSLTAVRCAGGKSDREGQDGKNGEVLLLVDHFCSVLSARHCSRRMGKGVER
jgi:hypothetical protein